MKFAIFLFYLLQYSSGRLLLIFRKLDTETFNARQICSIDQYCRNAILDEQKRRFRDFYFTAESLYRNLLVQIPLSMGFMKHNYLKSDIFFNPIIIPCFSGYVSYRVQVFQSPGFSGSWFSRVRIQVLEVALYYEYLELNEFYCYYHDHVNSILTETQTKCSQKLLSRIYSNAPYFQLCDC